jgi:DNA-binding MarR family transcriptional regulator/ribosomal protein S18 acetylase RimI-like enzyme
MDLIRQLGPLALGSRLKRLTVRMNKDVSRVYRELGLEFEARWFPVAHLLREEPALSISEIADALNYTHTAIKNFANEMIRSGLVEATQNRADRRKRNLRLTRKGRRVVSELDPVWREIHAVAGELVAGSEPDLLDAIRGVELQLDQKEVYPRIRERLRSRLLDAVEITPYKPAYKKHFRSLNAEWLNKHFRIEPHDERLLSDPKGTIIDPGGAVLFARREGRIVGTAALIRHADDLFELAKMAVAATARRRFVGTKLTLAIIDRAREHGARFLFLETHSKLRAAQRLYEKVGFERIAESPVPPLFDRRRIMMRIAL